MSERAPGEEPQSQPTVRSRSLQRQAALPPGGRGSKQVADTQATSAAAVSGLRKHKQKVPAPAP
eukprot:5778462-Alexandrium_andersonii.AAC.1